MNDTPQGDGNIDMDTFYHNDRTKIRMNDTPQGDGNCAIIIM